MFDELRCDPMLKDKKSLPLSKISTSLPIFLIYLFIFFPLWLFLLLPFTLSYQTLQFSVQSISKLLSKKKLKKTIEKETILLDENNIINDKSSRKYDIIIYGATGFTGKMASIYIAKNYNSTIKWAIAGRRMAALEDLKRDLISSSSSSTALHSLDIIIADSSDIESLNTMTKLTRVVITTAGPFDKYGSLLVKSCAMHGTDYCDITGESDWVRKMIDLYDDVAKITGARIVNFCGHDAVPWDLLTLECVKLLKRKGEVLTSINFYDEINSSPSGGTLDTVFHSLRSRTHYNSSLGFDPLMKANCITSSNSSSNNIATVAVPKASEMKLIAQNTNYLVYDTNIKKFIGPFIMAMVMANCVKRSNALNNYSTRMIYREAVVYPSFMAGFISFFNLVIFGAIISFPPFLYILQMFLPAPGQGPTEKLMDEGFLKITGYGIGSNHTKVRAILYFPTDPGYRDTARMLVEAGLVLALESDKIKTSGGGIFTPASCQGDLLMQRLIKTGTILHTEYLL